jgi:flagellar biosynthetic protein FliS
MMMLTQTQKSYRMSAIQGASSIGLIVILLDTLADDLRRAAAALRANDIENRCRQLNHGALVLGQLENWVDRVDGGESAILLHTFYAHLRAQMMQASVARSPEILEAAIDTIMNVRTAWQQIDARPLETSETLIDPMSNLATPAHPMEMERVPFSMSG